MWYKNIFRRHLCDMHIDDWSEEFLSAFSPESYLQNLKVAKIQNAMLYFQSHVGLCYYPTQTGKMHRAFQDRETAVKELCQMCKENGIYVTGYYSLIYNNWAHDTHPQWRMVTQDGVSLLESSKKTTLACAKGGVEHAGAAIHRYGLCCPNNMEYRRFTARQIKELCEYFTFDGMFFDMLFWPHACYCESCKKRWREEVGGELPTIEDWNDPKWLLHMKKRREWMGEFAGFAAEEVRKHLPHASVYHNVAYAALPDATKALAEEVLNQSDYAGGDLYGGIYAQSFVCKLYKNATKHPPFEYMLSRCTPSLSYHTVTKSEDELTSAVFLTCAHHGATLVIDAIDPVGTMDSRVYDTLGRVFEKEIPYEPYLTGDMLEEVGIYYSLKSKFNPQGEPYTNHKSAVNVVKTMIQHHIPCGVTGTFHPLDSYKLIVAPYLTDEDQDDYNRILRYVREGGKLYLSGGNCRGLLKEFFGASVSEATPERVVYLAPQKKFEKMFEHFNSSYPMHFDASAPIAALTEGNHDLADEHATLVNKNDLLVSKNEAPVNGNAAFTDKNTVLATITLPYTRQDTAKFASIHSNPPGIKTKLPAMLCCEYGKGKVLWSALPIEDSGFYEYRNIFINLLTDGLGFESSVYSNAPKDVEIITFRDGGDYLCSTVLLTEEDQARKVESFAISIKTDQKPLYIELLTRNRKVDFTYENNTVTFQSENLEIFQMYKIKF